MENENVKEFHRNLKEAWCCLSIPSKVKSKPVQIKTLSGRVVLKVKLSAEIFWERCLCLLISTLISEKVRVLDDYEQFI